MFEQTFVQAQARTRKSWTVGVSFAIQAAVITLLMILPLLNIEHLAINPLAPPPLHLSSVFIKPIPPATPTPRNETIQVRPIFSEHVIWPTIVTPHISAEVRMVDAPEFTGQATIASTVLLAGVTTLPSAAQPKPPAVVEPQRPTEPLRVSTGPQAARLISAPKPSYPPLAKIAHTQGTVRLEAFIAADGGMRDVRIISGPPLLINAARDAVMQWRYGPTLLNGVAVEVITVIDVTFTLTGN